MFACLAVYVTGTGFVHTAHIYDVIYDDVAVVHFDLTLFYEFVNFIVSYFLCKACPVCNIRKLNIEAACFFCRITYRVHFIKHKEYISQTSLQILNNKDSKASFLVVNTLAEKLKKNNIPLVCFSFFGPFFLFTEEKKGTKEYD